MKLMGVLFIEGGLYCKKGILDKSYNAVIGGFDVKVFFPKLCKENKNKVGSENPLLPPENADDFKSVDWGSVLEYPSYNSIVERVLIEAEVNDINDAKKLYDDALRWTQSIISFCELCTKRRLKLKSKIESDNTNLQLFYNNEYVSNDVHYKLSLRLANDDVFIDENQIIKSLEFSSSGKELLLEYQMLLSSYQSVIDEENRKAVLDACCAVEIVLTKLIRKYCLDKKIKKELLLSKYKTLGEKFFLLTKIDKKFPKVNFLDKIVTIRNNMIHLDNVFPNDDETKSLIENVETILYHYSKEFYI